MRPQYCYRVVIREAGFSVPILEAIIASDKPDWHSYFRDEIHEEFSRFVHGYMDEKMGVEDAQKWIDKHTITVSDHQTLRIIDETRISQTFEKWLDSIL